MATLADSELEALLHSDGVDELAGDGDVVARHSHLNLGAVGVGELLDIAGDVGGTEVELRTVASEERGVTATLLLGEDVDLAEELLVRGNRARLAEDLATLDLLTLDAAEKNTDVIASHALIHGLAEHLDAGGNGGLGLLDADDLDGLVDLQDATLDTTGGNGAAAGDGHNVLDSHQERLLVVAGRRRDVVIDGVHELDDGVNPLLLAVEGAKGGAADDRQVVAGEVVLGEEVTGLHLDQVDELLVVNHIALVQEDDDVGDADLTGEEDVLAGLSHGAVGSSDDQDSAVHLSSAGDHVLDVVGVARAVDVSVVALPGLVLDVSNVDGNAALTLLGSLVDVLEGGEVGLAALALRENLGDSGGRGGLAVVDVTNRTNVYVRLRTVELLLGHCHPPLGRTYC